VEKIPRIVWSWEGIAACVCLAGGLFAALIGSVLTAFSWIAGNAAHAWIRATGTGLLFVTIPMLILAGYSLDWLENKDQNAKQKSKLDRGGRD
jgi:hypothetical protein